MAKIKTKNEKEQHLHIMEKEEIIKYYNDCEIDFKMLWRLDKCYGMHFGYFEKGDFSLSKAILRMNDQLLNYIDSEKELTILDAGCGYGGTSIHLAGKTKAKFEGITIVEKQVEKGNEIIKSFGLEERIKITNQDYTKTIFANNSFDVVFGIESICHANNKKLFLEEAFRILKKGGKLILIDVFNTKEKDQYTKKENTILFKMNNGWKVDSLETSDYFVHTSKEIGFENIKFKNITNHIVKNSIILYIASFPAVIVYRFGRLFKIRNKYHAGNVRTARYQYIALKKHLWEYGIFYAEKNNS
jgi:cyclopropane fatty-acyl-phospholipid synthase-like methyltransferase